MHADAHPPRPDRPRGRARTRRSLREARRTDDGGRGGGDRRGRRGGRDVHAGTHPAVFPRIREGTRTGAGGRHRFARKRPNAPPVTVRGEERLVPRRREERGVLLDLAIHDFDFLRWTLGPVEHVFARRQQWDDHEYALATLRFESGAVGHVDARWPNRPELPFVTEFELAGDEGLLEFDSEEVSPIDVLSTTDTEEPQRDPIDEPLEKDPYRLELEAFVDCVRSGTEPPITGSDGVNALRIALAAIESAETGRRVAPEEVRT
ncbi:Gfo/Idh/MocA family protein [Halalkalicoccus salilacus]|uniref:Gfo/Idh/MocA family protein n=1 Tax=Halalkalicoccus sp. GCM10025704 TaxID=3252662 RepID=UPI00360E45B2